MRGRIKILTVDDEVRFLEALAQSLSVRYFDVLTATNGYQALEMARGHCLDLALVDLKMPGMDGEELLARLKEEHPYVEVVILTGHGSADSEARCHEIGSYCYLQKPCKTHELVEVLREAFQKRVTRRLKIEREELATMIQGAAGESALKAILRLKEIEEELLEVEEQEGAAAG